MGASIRWGGGNLEEGRRSVFGEVASDERELGDFNDLPANWACGVGEPVDGSLRDLLGEKDAPGRGEDIGEFGVPVVVHAVFSLPLDLVFGEGPAGVDLVDGDAVFAVQGIAQIAGHGHEGAL